MISSPRVLVTGSSGFLGLEICRQALQLGWTVRGADRRDGLPVSALEFATADITNPASLPPAFAGVDVVIHAAGLAHVFHNAEAQASRFMAVNEIGTKNVAEASVQAGVRHLVLVSTVAVYGGSRPDYDENVPCYPKGPYAESKWRAEERAREIAQIGGMQLTILRLATLYGEGDPGNVARLIRSIEAGHFVWVGNGLNRKSLLHRDDAARACLAALNRSDDTLRIYNVAATPCTMRQVVEEIADALGRRIRRLPVSQAMLKQLARGAAVVPGRLRVLSAALEKWLADDVYDGARFQQECVFSPQVDLKEGLRREVAWCRRANLSHV